MLEEEEEEEEEEQKYVCMHASTHRQTDKQRQPRELDPFKNVVKPTSAQTIAYGPDCSPKSFSIRSMEWGKSSSSRWIQLFPSEMTPAWER